MNIDLDETELATIKRQAFEMRISGKNYFDIADDLGVGMEQVRGWVTAELERRAAAREQNPALILELDLATLSALCDALQTGAKAGEPEAARTIFNIIKHRERLLGLFNAEPT